MILCQLNKGMITQIKRWITQIRLTSVICVINVILIFVTMQYGNDSVKKHGYKLDSVSDAKKIVCLLRANRMDTFIVAGGGYTGVEVVTNLRRYLTKKL